MIKHIGWLIIVLIVCMLKNYMYFVVVVFYMSSVILLSILFFHFFSFGNTIKVQNVLSVLIWVQTVCKGGLTCLHNGHAFLT